MIDSYKSHQKDVNTLFEHMTNITKMVMYAAEGENLDEVLQRIADASRELVQARYAALGVPDGNGGLLFFKQSGMDEGQVAKIPHYPEGRGLLGVIMSERQALRMTAEEMSDDPRRSGFPPNHPPMETLLGVPILVGGRLYGMLYLADRLDGQPFSENDQRLIETLSGYAALAIAGSELREQESRLALLEERERISMELHDGVIQSLYAIGMQVELMRMTGNSRQDEFSQVVQHLNTVIEDIRKYIMDLKIRSYKQKTVHECLEDVIMRLHIPDELKVIIDAPHRVMPVTPSGYESICHMANEALSNVVRHARATEVQLCARVEDNTMVLRVVDNGQGFQTDNADQLGGLGLRNIKQRARMLGGQVEIESAVGRGTRIEITVPTPLT